MCFSPLLLNIVANVFDHGSDLSLPIKYKIKEIDVIIW